VLGDFVSTSDVIMIDPRNDRQAWMCLQEGGCLRTADGGSTWNSLSAAVEVGRVSNIAWLEGQDPRVLVAGPGAVWSIHAGAEGALLFNEGDPLP
jgi:photosystem II stability/assembly factor-like uncharacterized protein